MCNCHYKRLLSLCSRGQQHWNSPPNLVLEILFIGIWQSQPENHRMPVLVAQSCLTLCNPMDCSPPGSSFHGILQARILEWGSHPFSRRSSQPRDRTWSSALQADSSLSEPPVKPHRMLEQGLIHRVWLSPSLFKRWWHQDRGKTGDSPSPRASWRKKWN